MNVSQFLAAEKTVQHVLADALHTASDAAVTASDPFCSNQAKIPGLFFGRLISSFFELAPLAILYSP